MVIASDHVTQMHAEGSLRDRYEQVRERVAGAARRSGRDPGDIFLVAVTKNAAIDQIRELIGFGHRDFGENRVQQLVQRAAQVDEYLGRHRELAGVNDTALPESVRWHMIGTLQRNKVRKVLPVSRLIHSVDSLRVAEEIQAAAAKYEEPIEVLLQVNVAGEKSKGGVASPAARHLIDQFDTMVNLRTRGLMCMAPLVGDPEEARSVFERCRELFEGMKTAGVGGEDFNLLSMGMTNDFEVAIECGANIVRVGTAIFGPPALEAG